MTNNTILLVEDEKNLLSVIKLNLEMEGHKVIAFESGLQAWEKFRSANYSLIILDVMLPGMDGFELCRNIRKVDKQTPVLFLTARGAAEDRITGLKIGADDYLIKPFHLEELLLRVKSLLKRTGSSEKSSEMNSYSFGDNQVNFLTFEIKTKGAKKIELTKKEIELLKFLIDRKNEVVPRETILQQVWGYDSSPSTRTVDNYMVAFRKYFEADPKNPRYFHSIRGVGYKFTE